MNRAFGTPTRRFEQDPRPLSRRRPGLQPRRPSQRSFDTWPDSERSRRTIRQALEALNDPQRKYNMIEAYQRELEIQQREIQLQQRELQLKHREGETLASLVDETLRALRHVGSTLHQSTATSGMSRTTTEVDTYTVIPSTTAASPIPSRHDDSIQRSKSPKHQRKWSRIKLPNLMNLFQRSNSSADQLQQREEKVRSTRSLDWVNHQRTLSPTPHVEHLRQSSALGMRGSLVPDEQKTVATLDVSKPLPRLPNPRTNPFLFDLNAPCRFELSPSPDAAVGVKLCRLKNTYRGALLDDFDLIGTTALSEVLDGVNDKARVAQTTQFELRKFFMRTTITDSYTDKEKYPSVSPTTQRFKWIVYILQSKQEVAVVEIQSKERTQVQWGFVPWRPATTISTLKDQVALMTQTERSTIKSCTLKGNLLEDWQTYRDCFVKPGSYGLCVDL